jgi:hypothetical protein
MLLRVAPESAACFEPERVWCGVEPLENVVQDPALNDLETSSGTFDSAIASSLLWQRERPVRLVIFENQTPEIVACDARVLG